MGNCGCAEFKPSQGIQSTLNINDVLHRSSLLQNQNVESEIINIKTLTWAKDSHNLFDYDNKNTHNQNFKVDKPGFFTRAENTINFKPLMSQKEQLLLNIFKKGNCFWIIPSIPVIIFFLLLQFQKQQPPQHFSNENMLSDSKEHIIDNRATMTRVSKTVVQESDFLKPMKNWLVVKSIQNNFKCDGAKIVEGDVLMLGRAKFKFTEIKFHYREQQDIEDQYTCPSVKSEPDVQIQCRMCLSGLNVAENPLINACNCMGTMKFVHTQCLTQWFNTKCGNSNNPQIICFYWNLMNCELCKTPIRRMVKVLDENFDLVELSKPLEQTYAIIEMKRKTNKREKDERIYQQATFILNFEKIKEFKLGRSNESHIRISDISVSRVHSKLTIIDNELFLQDNNSKFGTLLLLQQPLPILQSLNDLQIQAGRTLFEINTFNQQIQSQQKDQLVFYQFFSKNKTELFWMPQNNLK